MPSIDYLFDLPPIQDPFPGSGSLLSGRPSPLEPRPNEQNQIDVQAKATALSSRRKALAQAQPLNSCAHTDVEHDLDQKKSDASKPTAPDPEQARKKAKLRHNEQIADFVYLPRLQKTKHQTEKKPPFQPVAVLNELNEPPPSAGLFPPITPRAGGQNRGIQSQPDGKFTSAVLGSPSKTTGSSPSACSANASSKSQSSSKEKKKRVCLRERIKWTEEETEQLVKGVAIYGMGRWKQIHEHPEFGFHPGRTHADLKDKFRVLFPPNAPHKWVRSMPVHHSEDEFDAEQEDSPFSFHPRKKSRFRARKRGWTAAEDEAMIKGFEIHGYRWELMARDGDLHFDNRTGAQIRDRFRLRFPLTYAQQIHAQQNARDPYGLGALAASMPVPKDTQTSQDSTEPTEGRKEKSQSDRTVPPEAARSVNVINNYDTLLDAHTSSIRSSVTNTQFERDWPIIDPGGPDESSDIRNNKSISSTKALTTPPVPGLTALTTGAASTGANSEWPSRLLHGAVGDDDDDVDAAETARLSTDLAGYDWNYEPDSLTLPPLTWEDMVPALMFDIT